jgi:hypothetical protein
VREEKMRGKIGEEINHKTLVLNYLRRRGLRREEEIFVGNRRFPKI